MNADLFEETSETQGKGFDFENYLRLLLAKWYWFVLAIIATSSIAVFKILTTTPTYTRTTSLLIKDERESTSATSELEELGIISTRSNLANEIQTLKASSLMETVAQRLHLDVDIIVNHRLYELPLYKDAPVSVVFGQGFGPKNGFSCTMKLLGNNKIQLSNFNGDESSNTLQATFDVPVRVPGGIITISKTEAYVPARWDGRELQVRKYSISAIGGMYAGRLNVEQRDEESTILQLSLVDEVTDRADDILRTLIDVYNESWIEDKNRMAESTKVFISERLDSLARELGNVDRDISNFKSNELMPDVTAAGQMYMGQSSQNQEKILALTNELSMAQFLLDELNRNNTP